MKRFLVVLAVLAGVGVFEGLAWAGEQRVTCRSNDYSRKNCPIDRDAVEVELSRQLSSAACIHDATWGAERGRIWVDRGCGAEFIVFTPRESRARDGDRVICSSTNYRHRYCSISDRVKEVELVRRISDAPCVYGRSWGFERGRLWVDRGCAAEFEVSTTDSRRGGSRRGFDDDHRSDRDRPRLERLFAERRAVRACRRYGEDHPDRLSANWAEANPHETFKAEAKGRRDENRWRVSGRFKTFNRGREGTARARCEVRGDRVTSFKLR